MKITWYGHSTFRLDFDGTAVLFDPFFTGNPTWEGGWTEAAKGVSHILLTHGHDDHVGDTAAIAAETNATVVASYEIIQFLSGQGVTNVEPGNHGGEIDCGSFTVAFVNAWHSSATATADGIVYLGNPVGFVVTPKSGGPVLYNAGDTGVFGDMALIQELYAPQIGLIPIGDRFTMGPKQAAFACKRFFDFSTIVPCHYGTFGLLTGTVDAFKHALGDGAIKVIVPERGVSETVA
ncbi:MAG: metal-dependent hydrolase [Pseudomonadota bacterium]